MIFENAPSVLEFLLNDIVRIIALNQSRNIENRKYCIMLIKIYISTRVRIKCPVNITP